MARSQIFVLALAMILPTVLRGEEPVQQDELLEALKKLREDIDELRRDVRDITRPAPVPAMNPGMQPSPNRQLPPATKFDPGPDSGDYSHEVRPLVIPAGEGFTTSQH